MTPTTKTEMLKSQAAELIKQYIALDGSSRPEYVYTAGTEAANGDPCTRTQYVYSGSTSLVIKRKESYSTWSSAYDI